MAKSNDTNIITIPHGFNPRWYQLEALKAFDSGIRYLCLVWSRRMGKDLFCFNLMVREAWRVPGIYYYFFPTYEQGRKALWENTDNEGRRLIDYIPGAYDNKIPNEFVRRINNQSMVIEFTNGSIIRIVAAEQVDKSIVGTNPKGAVFSEFSIQDPQGLKYMMPIFLVNSGWYIINGTPRGKNHFYDLFKRVEAEKDWFVRLMAIDQAHVFTPDEIKAMEKQLMLAGYTEDEVQQEMYCSWAAGIRGAYYADLLERAQLEGRIGDFVDNGSSVDTFWDLGVDDDTAIWFRQIQNGKIVFIDYYKASGEPTSHYVDVLKEKKYRYRTHYLPHDGNNRRNTGDRIITEADMLREALYDAKLSDDVVIVPKSSPQAGIQSVRYRFPLYHFNKDKCKDGLISLEQYHRKWDPNKGVYSQHAVHDYTSHAADAIRTEGCAAELSVDQFSNNDIDDIFTAPKVNSNFDHFGDD